MANRQDSGSNSSHENQRPTSHNEDAVPEMTDSSVNDNTRNLEDAEDSDDEFEDTEDLDEEEAETEGSF